MCNWNSGKETTERMGKMQYSKRLMTENVLEWLQDRNLQILKAQ